jgi:hypothetical protein
VECESGLTTLRSGWSRGPWRHSCSRHGTLFAAPSHRRLWLFRWPHSSNSQSSLGDALETPRHLLLFHLYSDVCIFLGLVYLAHVVERAWPRSLRLAGVFLLMAGLAVLAFAIGRYELAGDRMPRMVPAGLPADAVDDTSAAIRYSGNWKSDAFGSAFHGTLTFSDQPGASARYSFEGTELQYVYTKSPNREMALVTIDGGVRRELDLTTHRLCGRCGRFLAAGCARGDMR